MNSEEAVIEKLEKRFCQAVPRECLKIHLRWSFCTNHRKGAFAFLPISDRQCIRCSEEDW